MNHELYKQSSGPKLRGSLGHLGSVAAVVLLLIAGFWGGHRLAPRHSSEADDQATRAEATPRLDAVVKLTEQKERSAGIDIGQVEHRDLQAMKTVAARIGYDATRHLMLKAPVDCVVERLLVKPGQQVSQGDPLAVLAGSEIALARTEIQKCEADVRIAQIKFEWTRETHNNLVELLALLKTKPTAAEIEVQFDDKSLGAHRDHLLKAYTQFLLASSVADRTRPLREQGIVAGRTADERSSQRDVAATAFTTACEQSGYEARRELADSQAALDVARQQLAVCQERLRLLLGPFADESTSDDPDGFELRAPFDGRVEAINSGAAARVAKGEPVLLLADTAKLWVSALIHQHDWDALKSAPGQRVHVSVPAIPDHQFAAQVSFIGPEMSPTTRAISLVAELDNSEARLRPGMFAWVSLPLEPARQGLAVPPSAIQRHGTDVFVFAVESPRQFRRVDVTTGVETAEYVEISQGLPEGTEVVVQGAFYLKSELLLEQEDE